MATACNSHLKDPASLYQFAVGSAFAPGLVEVHDEQGTRTIEPCIESADGCSKDDGGNKSRHNRGQHITHKAGKDGCCIGKTRVEMYSDQSRYIQQQGRDQFTYTGQGHAFLSLRQTLCRQGLLHNVLFHAPVIQIDEEHAGKQRAEGNGIMRPSDGIEVFLFGTYYFLNAREHTAIAQVAQAKPQERNTTHQQSGSLHQVRHGDGFEPAQYSITTANNAYHHHQ